MVNNTTRENIFVAWDRMNTIWFRYWTNYEAKGKTLGADMEANKEHQERFKKEVHFLIKSSCDLEFHQYLNKRLDYTKENGRKEGIVILKHMRELAMFVLLDKIKQSDGKFATTQDIRPSKNKNPLWWREYNSENKEETFDNNAETKQISYGHLHRMVNKYYPELLTTRIELRGRLGRRKYSKNGRKIEDHRERIVETQFSQEETIPPGIFELVVARAMKKDATPEYYERVLLQQGEVSKSMICDPIDLAKLLMFREDVLKIIDNLGANPFIDNEKPEEEKVFKESRMFNYLIQSLFLQVRALVELRWFREKLESTQNSIIFREPRLSKYYRRDAKKAVALNLQWFGDSEAVLGSMYIAGLSYIRYLKVPMPQVLLFLMKECLEQLDLSDDSRALVLYNIAMSYQQTEQYRLMLRWLRKSQLLWERIGDHPGDIADIHGYIAEYWRLRDSEKYFYNRNKAEELVRTGILTQRRKAFHYLFLSNCACMFKDEEWEKRLYDLGLMVSGKDATLEDFAFFFNQCLNDLEFFGKRGPEGGPGRYAQPKDWGEKISSPSFKATFLDPNDGN